MRQKTVNTKLLESVTEVLLQSARGITKCDRSLLQSMSGITKCDRSLLQSASGIKSASGIIQSVADCYYKVRQVLQSATAITK